MINNDKFDIREGQRKRKNCISRDKDKEREKEKKERERERKREKEIYIRYQIKRDRATHRCLAYLMVE